MSAFNDQAVYQHLRDLSRPHGRAWAGLHTIYRAYVGALGDSERVAGHEDAEQLAAALATLVRLGHVEEHAQGRLWRPRALGVVR